LFPERFRIDEGDHWFLKDGELFKEARGNIANNWGERFDCGAPDMGV
jgi:hypothetical protein